MCFVESVLHFLPSFAALGAAVAFVWSVIQFFLVRGRDAENRNFEAYHRLIKELVQPDDGKQMYLDRQAAIAFELRHFPKYYGLSLRTLTHLRDAWGKDKATNARLLEEIDLTLHFLRSKGAGAT